MSKKYFKTFKFTTFKVPILNAVIAILSSYGYNTADILQIPDDKVHLNGITLNPKPNGLIAVEFAYNEYAEFTRIDDLIIYLTSINFDTMNLARRAIVKMYRAPEQGITQQEFQAIQSEIPQFNMYLNDSLS